MRKPALLASRFPDAARAAASRWGIVAVAVIDTQTGDIYHNEFARYRIRTASIIKASVLLTVLEAKGGNPSVLSPKERADAEAMIRRSDNGATSRFWHAVGGPRVMDFIHRVSGTKDTVIAPENKEWWGYTLTTAHDMASIIAGAATRKVVTPAACDYLLSEMRLVIPSQRWGIPDGCSNRELAAKVAVKNGWYPEEDDKVWRVHSIGVAPVGDAPERAVIAVLTRYPIKLGMPYGQETCKLVAAEVLKAF